jgi:ABC-type Mn2+/Zn2+ transport system ATPase subunit/ABC-type Zn uptake system ZnuABC Zn-binding protein ZnuA
MKRHSKHRPLSHLCFSLVLCLSATTVLAQKPKVVCTTTIIYDITRNIAGELADVVSFLPIGGDPHIYEATPDDISRLARADLVLRNGLKLEGWLDKVIATSGTNATVVTVAEDGIKPFHSAQFHGAPDPHVWMSVPNGKIMARNIATALSTEMPEAYESISANLHLYLRKLDSLDTYIMTRIATIPEDHRVLVTTHDAFHYFADRYGLEVESLRGISTDAEIMAADATRVRDVIIERELPAIFIETTINPKVFLQIAKDLDIKIGGSLFADSIGDLDSDAGSYIGMLRADTDAIVAGLTGQSAFASSSSNTGYWFLVGVIGVFALTFVAVAATVKLRSAKSLDWRDYTIEVENLTVTYGKKTVLSNINLKLRSGQVYGVIGPNGSGKSTLFKGILDLAQPDSGTILINNRPMRELGKYVAYIPQKEEIDFNFPATVLDVVLNGRYPHKKIFSRISRADQQLAEDALSKVDMLGFRNRQIGQLSGGQQQRVFLARAVAQQAEVLLLDEPFSGVDVTTEERMIELLKGLAVESKTILVVHHDLSDVEHYFDQVIMLNQRLIAFGPTKLVFTDENIRRCYHGRSAILEEVGLTNE